MRSQKPCMPSIYNAESGLFCDGGAVMSVLYNPETKQIINDAESTVKKELKKIIP